jgi:hypothetical protein
MGRGNLMQFCNTIHKLISNSVVPLKVNMAARMESTGVGFAFVLSSVVLWFSSHIPNFCVAYARILTM